MLKEELQTAMNLARSAGAVIMDFYANGFEREEKIGADNFVEAVTIADRKASEMIVAGLREAFPADGILSEEETDDFERMDKKRVWMIDPIDGTLGFINRQNDFAVQIGLTENGESILGVVYMPVENVLYFASRGEGAFRVEENGEILRLRVSEKTDFAEMNLAVSFSHRSPKIAAIKKTLGLKNEIQRGSVGIKVGLLATGVCDLYIHLSPRTKFWDTCAPEVILTESGGAMTDSRGEKIRYDIRDVQNHNGIVATNGISHAKVIKKLKPLLKGFAKS